MSDFQTFIKAVTDGNLEEVMNSFQLDFLERAYDYYKRRPIHLACEKGHLEVVKFLFENKCSLECENYWKQRPIHIACLMEHLEVVKFLLQNKCSLECEDKDKRRPIHLSCQMGYLEVVKFLFQNKCSLECEDKDKRRPIHLACQIGYLEVVKFLLQNKCSLECEDKDKQRPIHLSCQWGNLEVLKFLIQSNCEIDCRTEDGKTPMEIAIKYRKNVCADFLNEIQERRKVFDLVTKNDAQALDAVYSPGILIMEHPETRFSLLEVALESNANHIIDYILNKSVNAEELSALENFMKTCCRPEAVQILQECLLYRSIHFHDADGFYLSGLAKTINGHGKLVKTSFLELAAEFGCKAFIHSILKKSIYNDEEWTKAHDLAFKKGHAEIAEAIEKRKTLLSNRADKNFTWLHSAVCDNDPDMMKYILQKDLVNPDFNNEVVGTALALAYIMCYEDCIKVLEEFNVDVNTENKYSQSPLHEAITSGTIYHCSYLISGTKEIDKPGFMGFTSLQCAVIEGYEELCEELLENGADCLRYVEGLFSFLISLESFFSLNN